MARTRKATTTATHTNGGNTKMAGLTNEQIMALLSKTRQKGVYQDRLIEFFNGPEAGICVNTTWPDLGGKTASTLKQGFEGAKDKAEVVEALGSKEAAERIIVKSDKQEDGTELVYLINLNKVEMDEAA